MNIRTGIYSAIVVLSSGALALAQAPRQGEAVLPARRFRSPTSAWPDGGEVPMKYARRGDNKSPAFEFHWNLGTDPGTAPATLKTYALILHDVENSNNNTTADTLHWTIFNIPGTATGIPEGMAAGDLADGTRNGPGIGGRGGATPAYFGPGAGPGPIHHYVFEFYALDTKLDLPATTTREDLLKAMDGHVVGKAAWFGRFHGPAAPPAPAK